MLVMLSSGTRYTVSELASRFSLSKRSVYRDFLSLEFAGFVLDKRGGTYALQLCNNNAKVVNALLHFSDEEAYLLYKTLDMVNGVSPVNERLVRKLNVLYDFRALSQLSHKPEIETIRILNDAIRGKKQVKLCAYRSSHSETIADRIVEPFEFLPEYSAVWCFDLNDKVCKQFKICRIEEAVILDFCWAFEAMHKIYFVDAFRMSAPEVLAVVEAELTLKAANLLSEEFPLAAPCLKAVDISPSNSLKTAIKQNLRFTLTIPVADFHGVGRFMLGLPSEVKVVGPESFKKYLKEITKKI